MYITAITINHYRCNKIIDDDIKNISRLSSMNIYSQTDRQLIKPIFVALTMANNNFM